MRILSTKDNYLSKDYLQFLSIFPELKTGAGDIIKKVYNLIGFH